MHPAKFKYAKKKKASKIVIKIAKKKHNSNKQLKSDFFLTAKHYTIQSKKQQQPKVHNVSKSSHQTQKESMAGHRKKRTSNSLNCRCEK